MAVVTRNKPLCALPGQGLSSTAAKGLQEACKAKNQTTEKVHRRGLAKGGYGLYRKDGVKMKGLHPRRLAAATFRLR